MAESWDRRTSRMRRTLLTGNDSLGVIITDPHMNPIAFNSEAAAILGDPDRPSPAPSFLHLPAEIREFARDHDAMDESFVAEFRRDDKRYVCRSYRLTELRENCVWGYLRALILERRSCVADAVDELSIKYKLSQRERETIGGLAEGLSGKELAERMRVSPNTVKAFVRTMMLKMGVTSREEIVAKLFACAGEDFIRRESGSTK